MAQVRSCLGDLSTPDRRAASEDAEPDSWQSGGEYASAAHWAARAADPDDVAAGVWADLTAWCGETSQHDDMTLLVMRVPGEPP